MAAEQSEGTSRKQAVASKPSEPREVLYPSAQEMRQAISKKVGITEDQVERVIDLAWPTLIYRYSVRGLR